MSNHASRWVASALESLASPGPQRSYSVGSQETKQLHHVEKQAKSQTKAEAKALKAQEKAQKALTKATAKVSAYLTLDAPTA